MAHKICPQCGTPASLEAGFCGQCGRKYRTQFDVQQSAPEAGADLALPTAPGSSGTLGGTRVAILVMAGIVAALLVMVAQRTRQPVQSGRSMQSVRATSVAPPGQDPDAASIVKSGEDPITAEAKRVVDRENARLNDAPPANAIGPDGRIHLRGGGSITREQWEDANRHLRNSREFKDPIPPPPVN